MALLRIELRALCMKMCVLPPNCTPTPEVNLKQTENKMPFIPFNYKQFLLNQ